MKLKLKKIKERKQDLHVCPLCMCMHVLMHVHACITYACAWHAVDRFWVSTHLTSSSPPPLPLRSIDQVTCSVQGLDSKLLKSYLKKESCYTSMMASARIRGVDRVVLVTDHIHYERKIYKVTDDMTFGHLIDDVCQTDQLTQTLLDNWYLVDKSKGRSTQTFVRMCHGVHRKVT